MSQQQHRNQQQQQQQQHPQNSYSNPAFCQQSEFYKSPQRSLNLRQSPVGAQTSHHILDTSIHSVQSVDPLPPKPGPKPRQQQQQQYEEQEFYEEMVLDHNGAVQEKKFVVVHNDSKRYVTTPGDYKRMQKTRYEYIPMQDHDVVPVHTPKKRVQYHEEVEASTGVIHRYAVIPDEEEEEEDIEEDHQPPPPQPQPQPKPTSGRYALVPVEDLHPAKNRYAVITPDEIQPNTRYDYPQYPQQIASPRKIPNPAATQKLYELLSTPRKTPIRSPSFKSTPKQRTPPRAQQKLNYAIGTRQPQEKRHTAIVAPMCSSPVQSVYSETTYKSNDSWGNGKKPAQTTLAVAAFMMVLCGGVTTGLCFYMISFMGRLYFLDFGVVAGFGCFLLGLLGFRSRNIYWLPNRNYISGYFILSVFSLLTCAGLLVLLSLRPKPGTPLADMTSGAVCGISGLSLLLAGSGVVASYCCKLPPPDNRVQHCAQGFSV